MMRSVHVGEIRCSRRFRRQNCSTILRPITAILKQFPCSITAIPFTSDYPAKMTATAALLASLDAISLETRNMLATLDDAEAALSPADRREAKRRVYEIRGKTQELFDWLSEAKLEEPRN
jgi:hypothetical protein